MKKRSASITICAVGVVKEAFCISTTWQEGSLNIRSDVSHIAGRSLDEALYTLGKLQEGLSTDHEEEESIDQGATRVENMV